MFSELFTEPKTRPEFVGVKLSSNIQEWDNAVMDQLGNTIDTSKYQVMIDYKKIDPKKGNAAGNVSIKVGDKVSYIPLIIHDFYLQPFDIFQFEEKPYPLRDDLLSELLSDDTLMLNLAQPKQIFPSHKQIEGANLVDKIGAIKEEEKKALLEKVSDEYKSKVENIKTMKEFPKLAILNIEKMDLDKYLVKYAFHNDPLLDIRIKECNYQDTNNILEKVGETLESVSLPYRIRKLWKDEKGAVRPYFMPRYKEVIELDLEEVQKGGRLITSDGKIDTGRILPLVDENATLIGRIFLGKNGYGIANEFRGIELGKKNIVERISFHPREGDPFIFIFSIDKPSAMNPESLKPYSPWEIKYKDEAIAMGPFEYMYTKKTIGLDGKEETRIYATKNLAPVEFVISDRFMQNIVEKNDNSYFIPFAKLCRLNGVQTNYIGSMSELQNKLAMFNIPYIEVKRINADKFMVKCAEGKKMVNREDRDLILSKLGKKGDEKPIFTAILGKETTKEIKEAKKKEKEKGKKETDIEEEEKKAKLEKIRENDFLKEAEELHFDEGVDAALGLNLLTPERTNKFVSAIPDFWRVLHTASEMLLASRLGMKQLDAELLRNVVHKLYNIIEVLNTLK